MGGDAMKVYRHGDVLISSVGCIPPDARSRIGLVLVRGELTGHAHRVEPEAGAMASLYAHEESLFLLVERGSAAIVHEEHAPIRLPAGTYRVWRQREYDPTTDHRIVED